MRVARTRQLLLSQAALHGWLLHLQQQQYHRKVEADTHACFRQRAVQAWRAAVQEELTSRLHAFIADVPLMAGLNDGEVQRVCDALQIEWVAASSEIITQGDEGAHFYIVLRGSTEV